MVFLSRTQTVCLAYILHKKKQEKRKNRRFWVHPLNLKRPREGQFQVTFMTLRFHPDEFLKYYRMSISSFDELLLRVKHRLQKKNTILRDSIPPEERLSVTLRYLATGTNFSSLHFDFLMGVSTIAKVVNETCMVVWDELQPTEMAPPTQENWLEIADGFYNITQFPNCVGAVDGKHIRLQCPKNSGTQYYNYKNFFSLVLMAICDSNYCFTIIDVGSFGKESDCNIFKQCPFGKKLYSDKINFPQDKCLPGDEDGVAQPFVLIADEAFALNKHLLRPFPGRTLNDSRRIFNYRLSRARQKIECTFGILSNKWRVFHSTLLVTPDVAVSITKAACVLHNFVRRRDGFNFEDTVSCEMPDISERIGVGNASLNAKDIREYFVKYFNNPKHALSWQNKVLG
ncbi:uncharacterized protein LOC132952183 [Metopolophium dirhodum]|uniref:uncharacterized protein LOC132952183 n=1 Tax=Metopolophium dirhodum TaxID=44670 RepID=UPI0029900498|nr:uncharacterized protein LOC132952183 [Metopolophium dirhodum]